LPVPGLPREHRNADGDWRHDQQPAPLRRFGTHGFDSPRVGVSGSRIKPPAKGSSLDQTHLRAPPGANGPVAGRMRYCHDLTTFRITRYSTTMPSGSSNRASGWAPRVMFSTSVRTSITLPPNSV